MTEKIRILVPPGIGDIYWVLVKLRGWMMSLGLENARPEITLVSYPMEQNIHLRALPYLQLFDWFDIGDPPTVPNDPYLQPMWDEAYLGPGRSIFPNVMGFDYFIAYNGRINSGGWIEDDGIPCEWDIHKLNLDARGAQWREAVGQSYTVQFWPFYGTYMSHLEQFPLKDIAGGLNSIAGKKHLFIGAKWDLSLNVHAYRLIEKVENSVNMIGETTLLDTLAMMKGADMVVGYHAGMTNLAAALGFKTILLWDDRYPESTSMACVPPSARGTNYQALFTQGLTRERFQEVLA